MFSGHVVVAVILVVAVEEVVENYAVASGLHSIVEAAVEVAVAVVEVVDYMMP